jgi:hypothetical protein
MLLWWHCATAVRAACMAHLGTHGGCHLPLAVAAHSRLRAAAAAASRALAGRRPRRRRCGSGSELYPARRGAWWPEQAQERLQPVLPAARRRDRVGLPPPARPPLPPPLPLPLPLPPAVAGQAWALL